MASVTDNIIAHLEGGKSLTALECLNLFGCLRLAARVYDLREIGHNIEMERIETPSGKRVGRYTLLPPKKVKVNLI